MPRSNALVIVLVALATPRALSAQPSDGPRPVRATIVHIDGADVFVDVAAARVQHGSMLTVYRRIDVRHPVTRKRLSDRFPIGTLRVARAGETLSLAHVEGSPAHPFALGDAAEAQQPLAPAPMGQAPTDAPPPPAAQAPSGATASSGVVMLDAETRELLRYFYATLGKSPAERVRLYRAYLERQPSSRYAAPVISELRYLEAVVTPAHAPEPDRPSLTSAVHFDPVTRARQGDPIDLAIAHDRSAGVRGMIVHARPLGGEDYRSMPMTLDGQGHARTRVPAELADADGLEYFVEAVSEAGETQPVSGSGERPNRVEGIPVGSDAAPREPTTRVRFSSELVSFDGTSGRDYFLLSEGDFLYRVRLGALRGIRMGYGHYRGQGGTVQQLDELKLEPGEAGFSYGFTQADLALSELLGVSIRATVGMGRPEQTDQQRDGITGGFQLRSRIGQADGTHLVLAGELIPEIGQRAYLGLNWEAIERLPMATEVHVTDQPVNSNELAVRLVYELGYRFTDRIALALRPSYQLRTIKHAGPGIGMAATFDW